MFPETNFILPITIWGKSGPRHRITCIILSRDGNKLITGSSDGFLCLWNVNHENSTIIPVNILMGHGDPVTCLACGDNYVISCTDGGQMSRWNLEDGYCTKTTTTKNIHKSIQIFKRSHFYDEVMITCGFYVELYVINPFTLQTINILHSKSTSDWLSCFDVIHCRDIKSDVVSAITVNGVMKLWLIDSLEIDCISEVQSNQLQVKNALTLKYNLSQTQILVVSSKYWEIFTVNSLRLYSTCTMDIPLVGGQFISDDKVCIWSAEGNFHMYEEGTALFCFENEFSVPEPCMSFNICHNGIFLISGDFNGKVYLWNLQNLLKKKKLPSITSCIEDHWLQRAGLFEDLIGYSCVTCCVHIPEYNKFLIGCEDGTIIIAPAMETVMSFYFKTHYDKPNYSSLVGHNGRVTCLLYPYSTYSHYNQSHVVSGGGDSAVCLWDINNCVLLHKFCLHSMEVTHLLVPPDSCKPRVKHSVCSVSADNSVAVVNLKERRCVVLASRHTFPVVTVNWKPEEDFILIECFDGAVYVWEIETGHLDRILQGETAQQVLISCRLQEEELMFANGDDYDDDDGDGVVPPQREYNGEDFILRSQTVRMSCSNSNAGQILCFNVGSLLCQMHALFHGPSKHFELDICKKMFTMTQNFSSDVHKKVNVLLEKIKQEAGRFYPSPPKRISMAPVRPSLPYHVSTCSIQLCQFLLSSLHSWEQDPALDAALLEKLGLIKPQEPLSFCLYSENKTFSMFLPSENLQVVRGSTLSAIHFLTVSAFSNVLELFTFNKDTGPEEVKDIWLQMALAQTFPNVRSNIEMLAKNWQNKCNAIRTIARKKLVEELSQLSLQEKMNLLEKWFEYLPHFRFPNLRQDIENFDLMEVALVLFGVIGAEQGYEHTQAPNKFLQETCNALSFLLFLPVNEQVIYADLQNIAVDLVGKGYHVWEKFLKTYNVLDMLFAMSSGFHDVSILRNYGKLHSNIDRCLSAYNSLKTIAVARTKSFVSYLICEIEAGPSNLEDTKTEMLMVFDSLLTETPSMVLEQLNEVVCIFMYCIEDSRLKQDCITNLVPSMRVFQQLHHSVAGQKVAVGRLDGSIILHDLKNNRNQTISAHNKPVTTVKFSPDSKYLASFCHLSDQLLIFQITSGLFGLGQLQVKCVKSFKVFPSKHVESWDVASILWTDQRSITLRYDNVAETSFRF